MFSDASAAFYVVRIKKKTSLITVTLDPCRDAIGISASSAAVFISTYGKLTA
jgi:hypothetical protein